MTITDKDMRSDYYESMQEFTDEFTGQYFKGTVIYAYVTYLTYTDKKTQKSTVAEVLNLIVQMGNDNVYVPIKIWGRKKYLDDKTNKWGDFGKNPVQLQDFLYLAQMQKGDSISEHYDFSAKFEDREVYPHICGTEIIVVAVTTEQGTSSKGRLFNKNSFAIFNKDYHSALEIMQKVQDKNDIKHILNEYKRKYLDYKGQREMSPMQEVKAQLEVAETETVKVDAVDMANARPQEDKPFSDDDLPF